MKLSHHAGDLARQFIVRELARTKAAKGDLADAMGLNASTLSKLLSGTRQLELDELSRAFKFFSSSQDSVKSLFYDLFPGLQGYALKPKDQGDGPSEKKVTAEKLAKSLWEGEQQAATKALTLIEVRKSGVGPTKDTLRIWPDTIEVRSRPRGFLVHRGIQAVYMAGDAGSPRYLDGEIILYDLDRQPAVGDYVIAETVANPEEGLPSYIGRLIRRTEDGVTIETTTGTQKSLPFIEVNSLRRIIPTEDFLV
jgi:hypothetical protein